MEGYAKVQKGRVRFGTGVVVVIAVTYTLTIGLAVGLSEREAASSTSADENIIRYDCHPDQGLEDEQKQKNCEARGCDWNAAVAPKCAYPNAYVNYVVSDVEEAGNSRVVIKLRKSDRPSGFDKDVQRVVVEVSGLDDNVVRIKVYDEKAHRWEVPLPVLHSERKQPPVNPKYNITADDNELKIARNETVIFQTHLPQLIFADQFLQLTFNVASKSLYGLGERQAPHEKSVAGLKPAESKVFTFLNHDGVEGKSSYGSHPFYLMYESKNKDQAHGVLLLNSNAMDITYTTAPALTYRTIGGVFDFLIFMGPTAAEVIQQKANLIGATPMPPYWSLGFHLCRWGYQNTSEVRSVFQSNTALGIPVDTQWVDIDYMDEFNDFTYDRDKFKDLPEFVDYLHSLNRRFVPILDPSHVYNESLSDKGVKRPDLYIKDDAGELLVTRVWNPLSVIPDFTIPEAGEEWKQSLEDLYNGWNGTERGYYKGIKYDGIWIDMNEPSATQHEGSISGCTNNTWDNPQYNPYFPMPIWDHSICFSARQNLSRHYDLHNLYGMYEGKATYEGLLHVRPDKRPFILSRATTTGQGAYTNHWLGDNSASWEHLRSSIPNVLDFNLFGIPMVGPDICGFNGDTTDELCSRWSALGAFYSFSRNHAANNTIRQDPASLGTNVQEAARKNLNTRYTLLPYLYTLFYNHTRYGDPVLTSLKFNFPEDEATNSNDRQFMWGDGLLVNPVLEEGKTSVDAYFPAGIWYDYRTGHVLSEGQAKNVTLDVPLTDINIALRGGRIFPTIPSVNRTTHDHQNLPFTVLAALDEKGNADGYLYWDDGEKLDALTDSRYFSLIHFTVEHSELGFLVMNQGDINFPNDVTDVVVLGVNREVNRVIARLPEPGAKLIDLSFSYVTGKLTVKLPPGTKIRSNVSFWWTYTDEERTHG